MKTIFNEGKLHCFSSGWQKILHLQVTNFCEACSKLGLLESLKEASEVKSYFSSFISFFFIKSTYPHNKLSENWVVCIQLINNGQQVPFVWRQV